MGGLRLLAGAGWLRACLLITVLAGLPGGSSAQPLVDPGLDYRTYRTANFAIHYPQGYLDNAIRLGELAQERHISLESRFRSGVDVTNIILIPETDTVNAFASTYVVNRVAIYVQSPTPGEFSRFNLWQDHLFTHEYTHIVNLYPYEGLPNTLIRILAGLPPNALTPTGLIEGFAVYEESQRGKGRLEDPLTNMIIRAAILENRFPELEEILAGTHRWPLGSTPYLFGGRFVQFLREYPAFQQSGASDRLDEFYLSEEAPLLSSYRLSRLGFPDLEELYGLYKEWETLRVQNQAALETPYRRLTDTGFSKKYLQIRHGRLYFFGSLPASSGIFSVSQEIPEENEMPSVESHSLSYFRRSRASGGFTFLNPELGDNGLANDANGRTANSYLLASQESFPDFSGLRYQLYREDGFSLQEVAPGSRILFPSASGNRLAYIKREDPYRHLMVGKVDSTGRLYDEHILLTADLHGILTNSVLSPDGTLVIGLYRKEGTGNPVLIGCPTPWKLYSRTEGGTFQNQTREKASNDQSSLSSLSNSCEVLASTPGLIAQPSFSDRGILFTSDRTGVYEIYRLNRESNKPWLSVLEQKEPDVEQLSQSSTGLFYPVTDGNHLYAFRYFADGYDLISINERDLLHRDVSSGFQRLEESSPLTDFALPARQNSTENYNGPYEVRPYFAGLLFGISAAESGILAFDPLQRHQIGLGVGVLDETPYFLASYSYNRFSHSLNLSYARSTMEKRKFYCDAPRGAIIFLCLDDTYHFEYVRASVDRENPGREVDQQYTFGVNHEKHRNANSLASLVFQEKDINLSSVFFGYGISNAVAYSRSISLEKGFSVYGEAAFYPDSWVVIYDDYSKRKESAEFYSVEAQFEFFLPFIFDHHVPYLSANGRWTSGKDPEVYRVRLSSYMRGLVPELSPYGRGALVLTAEYRFPLFWLSRRILKWWPSLGLRYISLAPFYDYGQSFERQVFKDTWMRSYGLYTDIGLNIFYLPVAIRLTYARGEGPSGETSYGFGILVGADAMLPGAKTDPFARSLQKQSRLESARPYSQPHQ
ncbi:MAG: hypothetical protein RH862_06555 [Leptospiraceae bacterium]